MCLRGNQKQDSGSNSGHHVRKQAALCLQCHKCTAGCPLSEEVDWKPSQVIRLVQLGRISELLNSQAIWLCTSCRTCSARCPQGVDLAHIKDMLRLACLREGATQGDARIACAMETILASIERHGRLNELDMMAHYRIRTGRLTENMKLGIALMRRGKLKLIPSRVRDLAELKSLMALRNEGKLDQ